MVIDKNISRGQWPLARVVETFPDKHGIVRSVKLRTAKGYLIRPINNLVFWKVKLQKLIKYIEVSKTIILINYKLELRTVRKTVMLVTCSTSSWRL